MVGTVGKRKGGVLRREYIDSLSPFNIPDVQMILEIGRASSLSMPQSSMVYTAFIYG